MVNEDECARGEPQPTPISSARPTGGSHLVLLSRIGRVVASQIRNFPLVTGKSLTADRQRGGPHLARCCRGDQAVERAE